jgi:tripartite-type tricarboxylate transporter receptor subunit TctC
MREALALEETRALLVSTGAEPLPSTPEQYAADIDREETKWSQVVRNIGVKAN